MTALARRFLGPLLAASLGLAVATAGCAVSPRTVHTVGQVAAVALWTAAIAGHLTVLAYHDGHFHHEHCGHYRRWHQGRWVYYYGAHWEYYDADAGVWYYYAE